MISKSDLCWVLVRAAGLYLIYAAFSGAFTLLLTAVAASDAARDLPHSIQHEESSLLHKLGVTLSILLPLAFGLYLVLAGRSVHRCLMSSPPGMGPPLPKRGQTWMGLGEADLEAYESWLEQHPDLAPRSPEDKVAIFRDSQKSGP
jgi:hypothetical protein